MKRKLFVFGVVVLGLFLVDFILLNINDTSKDSFIFKKLEAFRYRGRWDLIDPGGYTCHVCCKDPSGDCTHENQPPGYTCHPMYIVCE